ncbi:MAG: ribosome maturation factor RimP [Neisseriaceae bacterium]
MTLEKIIARCLLALDYELVDVEKTPHGTLRVYIDKPPAGVTIEDCACVSQQLNRVLTVEGIDYNRLEISSPGLDRVLKKPEDFVRFLGARVQIKTRLPVKEQKRFIGKIVEFHNQILTLSCEMETKLVSIAFDNIEKARLKPEI